MLLTLTKELSFSSTFAMVLGSERLRSLVTHAHTFLVVIFLLLCVGNIASFLILRSDDGLMVSTLGALWVRYGDSCRKGHVEEWEQEAHASEYSGQELEYRWKDSQSMLGPGTPRIYPIMRSSTA